MWVVLHDIQDMDVNLFRSGLPVNMVKLVKVLNLQHLQLHLDTFWVPQQTLNYAKGIVRSWPSDLVSIRYCFRVPYFDLWRLQDDHIMDYVSFLEWQFVITRYITFLGRAGCLATSQVHGQWFHPKLWVTFRVEFHVFPVSIWVSSRLQFPLTSQKK